MYFVFPPTAPKELSTRLGKPKAWQNHREKKQKKNKSINSQIFESLHFLVSDRIDISWSVSPHPSGLTGEGSSSLIDCVTYSLVWSQLARPFDQLLLPKVEPSCIVISTCVCSPSTLPQLRYIGNSLSLYYKSTCFLHVMHIYAAIQLTCPSSSTSSLYSAFETAYIPKC